MESLIQEFIENPRDGKTNFELGIEYEKVGHYAAAMTCFMRCAEYGDMKDYKQEIYIYKSLLHISILIEKIGNRTWTREGYLLHAITLCSYRPEAYWLMSMLYEGQQKWQEAYMMACLGGDCHPLEPSLDIGFEPYMLLFQKAVNGYRVGYCQEARDIFISLPSYNLNDTYKKLVENNIFNLGSSRDAFYPYIKGKSSKLRYKFPGYETIEKNYSQMYQDMFVLSMLNGKRKGYYLEIGSADPFYGSNTYLLESQFGWKGISLEINEDLVKKFRENRNNTVLCKDATSTNYDALLKGTGRTTIDYLQIDCEPPATNYNILLSIPFEKYKFAVITFEHDNYADVSKTYKQLSREFLQSFGYELALSNVSANGKHDSEDWWFHPDLINLQDDMFIRNNDNTVKQAERYMINQ